MFNLTALPRVVRFAEVELGVQDFGSIVVCGKFQSVVYGDRVHPLSIGQEHFEGGEGDECWLTGAVRRGSWSSGSSVRSPSATPLDDRIR